MRVQRKQLFKNQQSILIFHKTSELAQLGNVEDKFLQN